MSTLQPLIGRNVRLYRNRDGMSPKTLAETAKISRSYLSKIENGQVYPQPHILARLSEALGVRPWKLFSRQEDIDAQDADPCPGIGSRLDELLPQALENTFSRLSR